MRLARLAKASIILYSPMLEKEALARVFYVVDSLSLLDDSPADLAITLSRWIEESGEGMPPDRIASAFTHAGAQAFIEAGLYIDLMRSLDEQELSGNFKTDSELLLVSLSEVLPKEPENNNYVKFMEWFNKDDKDATGGA